MTYEDAIKFLYGLQLFGAKLGLENTFRLADLCGNPQSQLRFIHVAGTNGKGSTCAMLDSIYRAAGLRVGLFTSPHLISFRERTQVNRQLITEQKVIEQVGTIQGVLANFSAENHPTFFEVVTVMALRHFAAEKCDLVIWETGLGGRLDATNIVRPLASVITNVQLDHEKWLGENLEKIATEKAGIIKLGVPVLTSAANPRVRAVIAAAATFEQAPLFVISRPLDDVQLPLLGEHQQLNAALARATVRYLREQIPVSDDVIRRGLETVSWPGRLQVVKRGDQTFLLDGAHNPAGAEALRAAIQEHFAGRSATIILGVMRDKDYPVICDILAPLAAKVIACRVSSERSADPHELVRHCAQANPKAPATVAESIETAIEKTVLDPFVVITGSLHFVGHALQLLCPTDYPDERALNEYPLTSR
jgi:dihydrofolate synthase/folylpolyglutamate synthase